MTDEIPLPDGTTFDGALTVLCWPPEGTSITVVCQDMTGGDDRDAT
ncbi:MAG: hypothetical protein PHU85_10655 [Phycisphaerae bacterium]|nr:hypothetical protein [Phycisphaerae bacterium]